MTVSHGAFSQPLMVHGGTQAAPVRTKLCWARWTASTDATQTLTDSEGITSITYAATGVFTVNFASAGSIVVPVGCWLAAPDVAKFQYLQVTSTGTQSAVVSFFEKAKANATSDYAAASTTLVMSVCFLVVDY